MKSDINEAKGRIANLPSEALSREAHTFGGDLGGNQNVNSAGQEAGATI